MKLKQGLGQLVKGCAAALDQVRTPAPGVVVLIYHRVGGGSGQQIDLPERLFEQQMAALAAGQRVVCLDDAVALLASDEPAPATNPVVVTFDDGTADFADTALPIMERYSVPSTLYLATAFVEEQRPFAGSGPPLSWSALADAVSTGLVTIGSHTHTHALLDRLPTAAVEDELDRSVDLIQARLGVAAEHFAYPKAVAGSPGAAAAVRHRFRSAALAGTRSNPYGRTDLQALGRSPVQVADQLRWFHHKVAGGMQLEGQLRSVLNRGRYIGKTT